MAILNWRDHPVLRFNDFPPASANENAVYIASDIGMAAFIAKGGKWQLLSVLDAVAQTYTWATKPPAAGNDGLEIIVTDWCRSRWYSDGTNWRPVGGKATLVLTDLSAYPSTATALTALTIPTSVLPALPFNELMQVPRGHFVTRMTAIRTGAVSGTPVVWAQWDTLGNATLARAGGSGTNSLVYASGATGYRDSISHIGAAWNFQSVYGSTSTGGPATANIPAAPTQPIVSLNVGGAGESIAISLLEIEYRA